MIEQVCSTFVGENCKRARCYKVGQKELSGAHKLDTYSRSWSLALARMRRLTSFRVYIVAKQTGYLADCAAGHQRAPHCASLNSVAGPWRPVVVATVGPPSRQKNRAGHCNLELTSMS